jgi:hypothetical protein
MLIAARLSFDCRFDTTLSIAAFALLYFFFFAMLFFALLHATGYYIRFAVFSMPLFAMAQRRRAVY